MKYFYHQKYCPEIYPSTEILSWNISINRNIVLKYFYQQNYCLEIFSSNQNIFLYWNIFSLAGRGRWGLSVLTVGSSRRRWTTWRNVVASLTSGAERETFWQSTVRERGSYWEITTFKSNQIKSFHSSSINAENQPRSSELIICQLWPEMAQYLNHKKIFCLTRRIFPTVKIFWWTPLFIKQWMDSVRFILKIVREREKTRACQFLIKATFCQQRHFLWVRDCWCIVNTIPPRPPIGQFRSRDRLAAVSLVSSSKLLNSDCFHQLSKLNPEI